MRLMKNLPKLNRAAEVLKALTPGETEDRLSDLTGLKDNPGALHARFYVPEGLKKPAPLVVVLHGCTQNAAVYDHGSGWSTLASA